MQLRKTLNSNQIKLIAIIAMTVDHLTWAFFPGLQAVWYVYALHIVGRLTAPIMWFFIAEGFHYTHDRKRYMFRLFLFAVISHFAYDFAFGIPFIPLSTGVFNQTSVMWSLAWAVALLIICNSEKIKQWIKIVCIVAICLIAFPSDWSSIAVMAPFFLYVHRGEFKKQARSIVFWTFIYALVYFIFIDRLYGALQMFTFLSIPVLAKYNGERGSWKGMKWLFYIYYPAHLVGVGLLRLALHGDISIIF
ncbi:MAG: conjugal transfer protein TraX [Christensenellaceae bacterium]|nr:conjugal transfer protein TraX [Christensenellaceae bacterium]